jgi:hypothetical protein
MPYKASGFRSFGRFFFGHGGTSPATNAGEPWGARILLIVCAAAELLILLAALSKQAYGYVDPGTGLLAVQIGGSMVAGVLFFVRSKLRRLLRIARIVRTPEETAERGGPASR